MKFKHYAIVIFALWGIILSSYLIAEDYQAIYEDFAASLFNIFVGIPVIVLVTTFLIYYLVIKRFLFPSGKTFRIKAGKHRSVYRFAPFFNKTEQTFKITLHKGWRLSRPYDQHNKIVGMNWGFPKIVRENGKFRVIHANSLRITQTTDYDSKKIELHFYGYYKGKKLKNKRIAYAYHGKAFLFTPTHSRLKKLVAMTFGDYSPEFKNFDKEIKNWGYYLFPYHGGKVAAIKDTSVTIYKTTKKVKQKWQQLFS